MFLSPLSFGTTTVMVPGTKMHQKCEHVKNTQTYHIQDGKQFYSYQASANMNLKATRSPLVQFLYDGKLFH